MAIVEARFNPPHTIDFRRGDPMEQISPDARVNMRVLQPGTHDVTPREWSNPNYTYLVNVAPRGTGTLDMQPRYSNSVMQEFLGSVPQSGLDHARTQVLGPDTSPIVIAGGYIGSPTGFALFAIISYVDAEELAS